MFLCLVLWGIIRATHIDQAITPFGLARVKFTYRIDEAVYSLFSLGFMSDLTGRMNGPLWSLAIEIQLYVFVFLIFALGMRNRILAFVVVLFVLYRTTKDTNNLLGYGAFSLGFLVSLVSSRQIISPHIIKMSKYAGAFVCIASIGAMLNSFIQSPHYLDQLTEIAPIIVQLLFALGFAVYLCGAPYINFRPLITASRFSYTLYIIHFPILLLFSYIIYKYTQIMDNVFIAWFVYFIFGCAAIYISYFIGTRVERAKHQKAWLLSEYATMRKQPKNA